MIHLIVQINVRAERLADFLRLVVHHRDCSRSEPGCIRFDVCRRGHAQFVLYEVWFDYAALEIHRQTLHYIRWQAEIGSMEFSPRTHEEFHTLRTVFTNGCFDLLHAGHIQLLVEAALFGDFLTVAVNSDASVRRLKGPRRPIVLETERVASLQRVRGVGEVVVFDSEDELVSLIRSRRPDVLVKGAEYLNTVIPGAEYAGRLHFVEMVPGVSTSRAVAGLPSAAAGG